MVIGLLALTAIPTVAGLSLAISERNKPQTIQKERVRMRKFTLTCWCAGRSQGKSAIHGGGAVLGDGKMWIQSPKVEPERSLFPFDGFYLDYPDPDRPPPAPTGLVSMVSSSPPMMNWIYVDTTTWEVRYGNRTNSRAHGVGDFGWSSEQDEDFETEPGGLVYQGDELFVAVEPRAGSHEAVEGRWEVYWDRNDDKLHGIAAAEGRLVLRVSLERAYIDPVEDPPVAKPASNSQPASGEVGHGSSMQSAQTFATTEARGQASG